MRPQTDSYFTTFAVYISRPRIPTYLNLVSLKPEEITEYKVITLYDTTLTVLKQITKISYLNDDFRASGSRHVSDFQKKAVRYQLRQSLVEKCVKGNPKRLFKGVSQA